MTVKLLTEHHFGFLCLKGGCKGSSESTLVNLPHCWKSHVMVHLMAYCPLLVVFRSSLHSSARKNNTPPPPPPPKKKNKTNKKAKTKTTITTTTNFNQKAVANKKKKTLSELTPLTKISGSKLRMPLDKFMLSRDVFSSKVSSLCYDIELFALLIFPYCIKLNKNFPLI